MERLGLGPEDCLKINPKLVYGRMTGWGQIGSLSQAAGHDINYIALTGALHSIGRKNEKPVPPLNLVGDFGGGALYLAMGIIAALFEAQKSGQGQVVDCAMTDGSASLMTMFYGFLSSGIWQEERGDNLLDSGAHFYNVYETKDNKFISIGSIEPQFKIIIVENSDKLEFKKKIEERLNPEFEGRFKIMLVPNITNICYGRGVGYKIEEIVLSDEIQKISATKIRAKMREEGKLK